MAHALTKSSVGKRIKQLREKTNLTQANLAKEAEITPAGICQIEAGNRIPSTPILARIAAVLGVSMDYLLGTSEEILFKDLLQDKNLYTFFQNYQMLDPHDRKTIQQQVAFLKYQKAR